MNTQEYTRIYTRIHMYTLLYISITGIKRVNMGIYISYTRVNRHTRVYAGMHTYAHVYTGIQKHTRYLQFYTLVNTGIYTHVKTGIHMCAYVYKAYTIIRRYKEA